MQPNRFDELVRPHLPRLYRFAHRLTGRAADAEDLLQDVLIKLYERRAELEAVAVLGPWLARVLYNQFVDRSREFARRRLVSIGAAENERSALEDALGSVAPPEDDATSRFDIRALERGLAALSLEHRTVLLMHDADDYKLEEIHEITGVPLGTLKSRLHRARARLRELLDPDGTF